MAKEKKKIDHHDLRALKTLVKVQEKRVKASLCSFTFCTAAIKTVGLILFYYLFSIGLTFYNRHSFQHSKLAIFSTMCHLVLKFVLSSIIRILWEWKTKEPRIMLDWNPYVKRIAAAGIVSALDIGLSNWSFEMVTVSLYTMSKSTAVIFILMFSLMFRLEKFRWSLVWVVLFIFMGLFLFTFHSTQFNLKGFILIMCASVLSGLRWTLAQIVLQKHEIGLRNPIDMMYHIQPWMMVALFPLCVGIEGQTIATTTQFFGFTEWSVLLSNIGTVVLGGTLGFMLEFSEFLLLSQTSGLTLSIAGVFKEICILVLAYLINHDPMSMTNGVGLLICLLGITVHVITKAASIEEEKFHEKSFNQRENGSLEMLTRNGKANDGSESDEVDLFSIDRDR